MMTESEAWSYLAQRWSKTRFRWFRPRRVVVDDFHVYGLCDSIGVLYNRGQVAMDTRNTMWAHLAWYRPPKLLSHEYYWRRNGSGARKRAALCRRLAVEAANESRA